MITLPVDRHHRERSKAIETTTPVGLVVADRHPITLRGIEEMCRSEHDFRVLATCERGEEAIDAVRQHRPDVLIVDLHIRGKSGLAVARQIKDEHLGTRVVLLADSVEEDEVLEAVRLGVKGVVLKDMPPHLLVQCIRKVHAGDTWVEKRSMARAVESVLRRETGGREVARLLTPREMEIFHLVLSRLRNKHVAEKLSISEGTVKVHLHNIYEKLDVSGRLELALYAHEKGIL